MICMNEKCEKIKYCKNVHELNKYEFNKDPHIMIPNMFYYELNFNNRFAKRGIPKEGFNFGCMKLIESKSGDGLFYINDKYITDFSFSDLLESCNNAFSEMLRNGDIKIY